jgi:hypothetical protein
MVCDRPRPGFFGGAESSSFLKKRTKKLLFVAPRPGPHQEAAAPPERSKSFLVLFFKKELLYYGTLYGDGDAGRVSPKSRPGVFAMGLVPTFMFRWACRRKHTELALSVAVAMATSGILAVASAQPAAPASLAPPAAEDTAPGWEFRAHDSMMYSLRSACSTEDPDSTLQSCRAAITSDEATIKLAQDGTGAYSLRGRNRSLGVVASVHRALALHLKTLNAIKNHPERFRRNKPT